MRKWVIQKRIILRINRFNLLKYFLVLVHFEHPDVRIVGNEELHNFSSIHPVEQNVRLHIFLDQNLRFVTNEMAKQLSIEGEKNDDIPKRVVDKLSNRINFAQVRDLRLLLGHNEDGGALSDENGIGTSVKEIFGELGKFIPNYFQMWLLFGVAKLD